MKINLDALRIIGVGQLPPAQVNLIHEAADELERLTGGQALTDQLFRSLAMYPCRCHFGPWVKDTDGKVERKLINRCSRCIAVEAYLARHGVAAPTDATQP